MTLDPWERWIVELETGPGSNIGPWVIVAILPLAASVARVRKSATKPETED
jgi:hypothetical protein